MDTHAALGEVVASAHALETRPGFPAGYVERARAAAAALAPAETAGEDVAAAAERLAREAGAGIVVPAVETSIVRRPTRRLVGRLVHWYLGFLIPPADAVVRAAASLGGAVPGRLDRVEAGRIAARDALRAEVTTLRTRVAELEDRLGVRPSDGPAGAPPSR